MIQFFKISDERFSIEKTDVCDLIFEVQFSRFRFIVLQNDSVIWLEDYYLGIENTLETTAAKIEEIISEHDFLKITFWKNIKVVSAFEVNCLLPENYYKTDKKADYIQTLYPSVDLKNFSVLSETFDKHTLVYALVKSVNEIFIRQYPDSNLQFKSIAEVALRFYDSSNITESMGTVSDSFVDIIYKNPKTKTLKFERILNRNLKNLNPSSENLVLFGEITPFGPVFELLQTRYQKLTMGTAPNEDKLTTNFSEITLHRYLTLLASL